MLPSNIQNYLNTHSDPLITIDSHTAGEATRTVVSGVPAIPGETLLEKRLYLSSQKDHFRRLLTREPRGSRETIAVVVTDPVTPGAAAGFIYMDAHRYPYMCGHGTIGAITSLIETGLLSYTEPETRISIDTPSGVVQATAYVSGGKVSSVSIEIVPCFVFSLENHLDIPGYGELCVDVVYAGGFFAMVDAKQLPFNLTPENARPIADLGMAVIAAANQQLAVQHPIQTSVTTIDVAEFYDLSNHALCRGSSAVVYGESHVDRSPCGTGTSAKLALLHKHQKIKVDQIYTNAGILGTTFEARITAETKVGSFVAVVPEITGSAYITGVHQFVLDPRDPFPLGFLL